MLVGKVHGEYAFERADGIDHVHDLAGAAAFYQHHEMAFVVALRDFREPGGGDRADDRLGGIRPHIGDAPGDMDVAHAQLVGGPANIW